MALNLQRLRRSTGTISSFIKHHRSLRAVSVSPLPFSHPQTPISSSSSLPPINIHFQYRLFRSTSSSLLSARYNNNYDDEKISPDTILFEGCDYNHWLITMDFPKDSRPTPEQMVETYVQTCAKGLNISVEEAKQKIYACSTTTYNGFQAVMTEEESKKFEGLPGVVFILPDSYIDPVNKEYGGDKYINGTIIPRPPPVQYGRQDRGRFNDQNRNPGRQRYDRGNPDQRVGDGRSYGGPHNYGERRDGRSYGGPHNYGERRDANMPPMNNNMYGESRDANMPPMNNNRAVDGGYQGERGVPMPSYQQQRGVPMPPMNNNRAVDSGYQGERGVPMPSYQQQGNYNHQGNYPQERKDIPMPGNFRGYDKSNTAPLPGGNYGPQGQGSGMQGGGRGEFYGQVSGPQGGAGSLGQGSGMGSGQGQSYPENGEGRRFS